MKLLLTADWHLTPRQPSYIDGDYLEIQERKLSWLKEIDADFILVAGDVFDSPYADQTFINWCLKNMPFILAIPGNHDLPVRNPELGTVRSIYTTMELAGKITTVDLFEISENSVLYGVPFNGKLKNEPENKRENILMVHRPVFKKQVPFWSKDGVTVKELVGEYKGFDIILSGDIHTSFGVKTKDGVIVVNQGGLFYGAESDPDKYVFMYDTESGKMEKILVPRYETFVQEKIVDVDEKIVDLFVKYIEDKGNEFEQKDYLKMLEQAGKMKGLDKGTKNLIMEVIHEVSR